MNKELEEFAIDIVEQYTDSMPERYGKAPRDSIFVVSDYDNTITLITSHTPGLLYLVDCGNGGIYGWTLDVYARIGGMVYE